MFKRFSCIFLFTLLCYAMFLPVSARTNSTVTILLNGKAVEFNDDTGYPYLDENYRTMVPLRATMETAGFAVGWDEAKQTAIVIAEHDRIEVPIGTNIVYNNNKRIENDTIAVIKNGRTYLPIRAVLEAADYTVEWDGNTETVNAYNFSYDPETFVPYSTSSIFTLIEELLRGNVVYVNGQYFATPKYVKMMAAPQIHYSGSDLNQAIYPQSDRFSLADFPSLDQLVVVNPYAEQEWISEADFWRLHSEYTFSYVGVTGGLEYALFKSDLMGSVSNKYLLDGLYAAASVGNFEPTYFNGIRVKSVDNVLYINVADLKACGFIK